ncbi:MAG: hypothetical protein WAL08_18460, partial [Candidatus Sulfotelmatobacter sp.]
MDTVKLLRTRFLGPLFAVVLLLGLNAAVCAQDQPAQPSAAASQERAQQGQTQKQADKPAQPAQSSPATEEKEVKITPEEAEELFHSVDEILAFDSKQTGLPIKKEVKRRLTSRDEVVAYLTKHMKD